MACVVDGKAGGDAAAGAVDIEIDGFGRIVCFEEEKGGCDGGRHAFIDFAIHCYDSFFEETREEVGGVVSTAN